MQKKAVCFIVIIMSLFSTILFNPHKVYADTILLKAGMRGESVTELQKELKNLGFFSVDPTGYYGQITTSAVKALQSKYGLDTDGIAGPLTFALIAKLSGSSTASTTSRGGTDDRGFLVPWFGGVENIFAIGETATVYDVDTGKSFKIRRSYGYNHADCEPLTSKDTAIMKAIYGGQWSWSRRAIIVTVNGRQIAASMAGMPHAGDDSEPANAYVSWRSEGYGAGTNLDTVKGNNMDGHFDIHFLGSRTHGTNKVDPDHQAMVAKAARWAEDNL